MTDTKPNRSPFSTHLAAFLLGVVVGVAAHPCTVITSNPPASEPDPEPGAADETGSP